VTVDLADSAGLGKSVHVEWFMLSPSDISATGMLLSCLESEEIVSYILTILFSHLSLHFCISFFVFFVVRVLPVCYVVVVVVHIMSEAVL